MQVYTGKISWGNFRKKYVLRNFLIVFVHTLVAEKMPLLFYNKYFLNAQNVNFQIRHSKGFVHVIGIIQCGNIMIPYNDVQTWHHTCHGHRVESMPIYQRKS